MAQVHNDSDNFQQSVFIEIHGHNYYSYYEDGKIGCTINYSNRVISVANFHVAPYIGYGVFWEKHRQQPSGNPVHFTFDLVHMIPIGVHLIYQADCNAVSIGGGVSFALGKHWIDYQGSQGSQAIRELRFGMQTIFSLAYTRFIEEHLLLRASITPHFYAKSLNSYEQKKMYRKAWIPVGISVGYCF